MVGFDRELLVVFQMLFTNLACNNQGSTCVGGSNFLYGRFFVGNFRDLQSTAECNCLLLIRPLLIKIAYEFYVKRYLKRD